MAQQAARTAKGRERPLLDGGDPKLILDELDVDDFSMTGSGPDDVDEIIEHLT